MVAYSVRKAIKQSLVLVSSRIEKEVSEYQGSGRFFICSLTVITREENFGKDRRTLENWCIVHEAGRTVASSKFHKG